MPENVARDKFWQKGRRVIHRRIRVTTVGSAGSAAGVAFVSLPPGRITHVAVDFHASAAATQDTTIVVDPTDASAGTGGRTVLTLTDTNTDIPIRALGQPLAVDEGRAATAATDATDGGAFFRYGVGVVVAQGDALTDCVVLDIWVEKLRYERVELIAQSGADGSAVVTRTLDLNGAGRLAGVWVDFQNTPATADVVIKADDTSGTTLFTSTNSNTDFGPTALGMIGIDEANGALAATDGSVGGQPFKRGLFFDVAQSDAFTSGDEKIIFHGWIVV